MLSVLLNEITGKHLHREETCNVFSPILTTSYSFSIPNAQEYYILVDFRYQVDLLRLTATPKYIASTDKWEYQSFQKPMLS